ncbi:tRNA adenosine(34) deaminase TadA [Bdellovibrio sp. ZAP7]|uniref:tRNA adenosine(34) deaminase TadA n=1 Tax=Bdellovibrio sp. ZAP7 TaxID=2231053 RepID=UPI00115B684B|nr:tRNA adenosine(34) deaminase TadA [Bdellovibrio sp. ZAP7]QDK43852.1 tRNA adenosine(34) deaminase TadA [Bdellovibrio sp. ZAP7]
MIKNAEQDKKWMRKALELAHKAGKNGEVPIGAVLVSPTGELLSKAANVRETLHTPLGHAELLCLHRAAKKLQSWRLEDCTLYVTLEPCVMCAGAIQQARVGRVVYAAKDAKGGAVESLYKVLSDARLNHQVQVTTGVLEKECSELISAFFQNRRDEQKQLKSEKVYRHRASAVVVYKNKILGFHAEDPVSKKKYFFLPGGMIDRGENAATTAVREAKEETDYQIKVFPETEFRRKYDFTWNGKNQPCDTIFYLATLNEPWHEVRAVQDADYHRGVAWIDLKDVDRVFAYDKDILWAVQKLTKTARKMKL